MSYLPLGGVKVIDFTGVPASPASTQLLAWFPSPTFVPRLLAGESAT
jgi:formyl-CoA transferase